mgnify:CR=1 FL=1
MLFKKKNIFINMRNKLKDSEKKMRLSIRINPIIMSELNNISNKSKYIEYLIYLDMKNKNIIKNDIIL